MNSNSLFSKLFGTSSKRSQNYKQNGLHMEYLEDRQLLSVNPVVTTALDVVDATDGATSLREAIQEANADADPGNTITFDANIDSVTLNAPLDTLNANVTIDAKADNVTLVPSQAFFANFAPDDMYLVRKGDTDVTFGNAAALTEFGILYDNTEIWQDVRDINVDMGIDAVTGHTYTFQYKCANLPDVPWAWRSGNVTIDADTNNVVGTIDSLVPGHDYDVRVTDVTADPDEIVDQDVFSIDPIRCPAIIAKADSTTGFTVDPVVVDAAATDAMISYRVFDGGKWSDWSEPEALSDMLAKGFVTYNKTADTYSVAGLPKGSTIQFGIVLTGNFDPTTNVLDADSALSYRAVALKYVRCLQAPCATVRATSTQDVNVKLVNFDAANTDEITYQVRTYTLAGGWSEWSAVQNVPKTDGVINKSFDITGLPTSATVQVRLQAIPAAENANYRSSVSPVYCAVLKQATFLTYPAFVFNGVSNRLLSFRADANADGYRVEAKLTTQKDYTNYGNNFTAAQISSANLEIIVPGMFTKAEAEAKIGKYVCIQVRITALSDSANFRDSIPSYSTISFKMTQDLVNKSFVVDPT